MYWKRLELFFQIGKRMDRIKKRKNGNEKKILWFNLMKNEVENLCTKSKTGFRMDYVGSIVYWYLWHEEIIVYMFYYRVYFSVWFQWWEYKVRKGIKSPGLIHKRGKKHCLNKLMLFYSKSLLKMKAFITHSFDEVLNHLQLWFAIAWRDCGLVRILEIKCESAELIRWIKCVASKHTLSL